MDDTPPDKDRFYIGFIEEEMQLAFQIINNYELTIPEALKKVKNELNLINNDMYELMDEMYGDNVSFHDCVAMALWIYDTYPDITADYIDNRCPT